MRHIEEYVDQRQKTWCIHCGATIAKKSSNSDHVPSKSLLSKEVRQRGADYDRCRGKSGEYLPQVPICKECNSGFSRDETYLLCVLHAVTAGSLYPDPSEHPIAANVLRSNRDVVRGLRERPDGQMSLFDKLPPFIIYPDPDRMRHVVVKNARGHAYHEIGEPLLGDPASVAFRPLLSMTADDRATFENIGEGIDLWPEVGSRMTLHLIEDTGLAGGWIEVEKDRYRYAVDWSNGVAIRTVIWEYLATETCWLP